MNNDDEDPVDAIQRGAAQITAIAVQLQGQRLQQQVPRVAEIHRQHVQQLPPPKPGVDTLPTAKDVKQQAKVFKQQGRQAQKIENQVLKEARKLPDAAKTQEWMQSRTAVLARTAPTPAALERTLRAIGAEPSITRTQVGATVRATHPSDPSLRVEVRTPRFSDPGAAKTTSSLDSAPAVRIPPPPGIPAAPGAPAAPARQPSPEPTKTPDR